MTPKSKIKSSSRSGLATIVAIILAAISIALPSTSNAQVGLHTDLNQDNTVNVSDVSYLIGLIMGRATDPAVEAGLCPNAMHPHVIDLGLPSSTKWTCCNVGAANPLGYGDYYAWGETLNKDDYSEDTYCHYDSENSSYVSIGDDIAGTMYDVATVKWGAKYSMPTYDQFKELVDNCTYSFTTIGEVNGALFTATNGKKVFLPAAGNRWGDYFYDAGSYGYYWSSTQYPSYSNGAYRLGFYSGDANYYWSRSRYYGLSVRPVAEQYPPK